MHHLSISFLRPMAFVALVAACHRAPAAGAPPGAADASEANVVAIVLAANNTDMAFARLVPGRAKSNAVKTFAQRMITDHTILNNRVSDVASRAGIVAEDNAISMGFRESSAQRRDALRNLEGAQFDSAYITNEIAFHTELLGILDKVLLPNARTPQLRQFVIDLKPAVNAHIAHAEQVRSATVSGK
jgi:putative membrane protein